MIHEVYMQQGSYRVPLRLETPPSVFQACQEFGHVFVTPQYLAPDLFSDAAIQSAARYAGPLLYTERTLNGYALEGAGMVWHLGGPDSDGPSDLETPVQFTSATPTTVLSASGLLPAAVTAGTITATGVSAYTAYHEYESPLEAIATYSKTVNGHWKVNPDATLDFSLVDATSGNPFNGGDAGNITTVVVRENFGSSAGYDGIPVRSAVTKRDATQYRTRVALLQERDDAVGYQTLVSGSTRGTIPYKDLKGNALDRTQWIARPASADTDLADLLASELTDRTVDDNQTVETEQYEIHGTLECGSLFFIYDPPTGFVDTDNEIVYRGSVIWPKKTRLLKASWPLADGMGVYYRDADGTYTDLTRWVEWEA